MRACSLGGGGTYCRITSGGMNNFRGVVVFAERAISLAGGGKGHGGSTQITSFYQAAEWRQTVVGIVGTMMAKGG